jgi:hypothetical protein
VKFIEAVCQLRPKSLLRLLAHPEKRFRAGMRWYSNIGRRVWIHEVWQWLWFDRRTQHGPTLAKFLKGAWLTEPTPSQLPTADSHFPILNRRPLPVGRSIRSEPADCQTMENR